MTPRIRLGGFKILKGIRGFSTTGASSTECIPVEFCGLLAGAGVNLPFLVCAGNRKGLYAVFDGADEPRVAEQTSGRIALEPTPPEECAVLSLFPHRENPTILSTFFQVLGRGELHPRAVALSHSAITAVLPESEVDRAAETLFEPFRFSSYRTPADWKMVRNENQVLYREVVASYQEKRPGVYGVTWADGQILFRVRIVADRLVELAGLIQDLTGEGPAPTFFAGFRDHARGEFVVDFCRPSAASLLSKRREAGRSALIEEQRSVCVLSMTGPHFGDRYGIAGELFAAFQTAGISPAAVGCSVASIYAVIPEKQIRRALEAVAGRFEVPAVTRKEPLH